MGQKNRGYIPEKGGKDVKKGTFICYAGGDQKRREGKGGKYSEKKNIFFAKEKKNRETGNFFQRRRKTERENFWRRKIVADGTGRKNI